MNQPGLALDIHLYFVITDKPKLKDFNNHVREAIAADWYDLGVELDLEDKLDEIQANKSSNRKECCTEMFKFWRRSDPNASWKKLIEALEAPSLKLHELAQTLRHKLNSGNMCSVMVDFVVFRPCSLSSYSMMYIHNRDYEALSF